SRQPARGDERKRRQGLEAHRSARAQGIESPARLCRNDHERGQGRGTKSRLAVQLGDIRIDRILELETPFMTPAAMFPDAAPEDIEQQRHWMEPWALDPATGKIVIAIQTYVIRTPRHTILVDTCLGC